MKTIIALRGKSNSGKTATLRLVAEKMLKQGFIPLLGNYLEKRTKIRGKDFWQVFEKDGLKIGVASLGDIEEQVRHNLNELDKGHQCNVIICACRSYGNTINPILDKEAEGFKLIWVEKIRQADESKMAAADEKRAEEVLGWLNSSMKEQL